MTASRGSLRHGAMSQSAMRRQQTSCKRLLMQRQQCALKPTPKTTANIKISWVNLASINLWRQSCRSKSTSLAATATWDGEICVLDLVH